MESHRDTEATIRIDFWFVGISKLIQVRFFVQIFQKGWLHCCRPDWIIKGRFNRLKPGSDLAKFQFQRGYAFHSSDMVMDEPTRVVTICRPFSHRGKAFLDMFCFPHRSSGAWRLTQFFLVHSYSSKLYLYQNQ